MTALRVILTFSILSTASHYAHNFVAVDDYPGNGTGVQVAIVLSWPLLTAIGLYGYRLYSQGRFHDAHVCLLLYAPLGLVTPLHFVQGNPDIPAFFYATIFTDGWPGWRWWASSSGRSGGTGKRPYRRMTLGAWPPVVIWA